MKKMSRREFIGKSAKLLAAASLAGVAGALPAEAVINRRNPNVLLIMVDQMQTPPEGYGPHEGAAQGLKEILGFRPLSPGNEYVKYFPGLLRLRQNAVIIRKHYTASAACVPSRACIMTGQYPSITGVDQTDGVYKTADDIPWLDPKGIPTIGDWFLAAGYETHYFGKWHVSEANADTDYLKEWGFSDWQKSYPEPHGSKIYNSSTYRDVGFADNVVDFLTEKGTDTSGAPWFAVGSLVNPHDISLWPMVWQTPPTDGYPTGDGAVDWTGWPPVPSIPGMGQISHLQSVPAGVDDNGVQLYKDVQVPLNPDGFPQDNSSLPPTYAETLADKPRCQMDYAYKWGLATETNSNITLTMNYDTDVRSPHPFQLQGENSRAWSLSYNQFYFYCQYLADLQIRRILQALDSNRLTDNTIVVFLSDHGDMTGAHGGMIQKWHNAYEEAIRVPMVISSPLVNRNRRKMREIVQPTSSIDFAPTILALAGHNENSLRRRMEKIHGKSVVKPLAGADLSSHVKGESHGAIIGADGHPRTGVFFMTNDTITDLGANASDSTVFCYNAFCVNVEERIRQGLSLAPKSVRQPNHVRALCTGDWKIVHYVDPNGVEADEWELYCLKTDPVEHTNLVDFRTGEVRGDLIMPGFTKHYLKMKNRQLRQELARQEAAIIGS